MFFSGDEYYDDDVTSGLSTIDPWYLLAPIDETTGEEGEPEEDDEG
jgi:hypothetical protein